VSKNTLKNKVCKFFCKKSVKSVKNKGRFDDMHPSFIEGSF
jgi:hypothetical protein